MGSLCSTNSAEKIDPSCAESLAAMNAYGAQAVGGGFFSRTSKNVELKGGTLQAMCQTSAGGWMSATLDLNFHLENIDGKVQVTTQPPGNFLETCKNVKLAGTLLSGMARRHDSSWQSFKLDLDEHTANREGHLSVGGGFFSRTSKSLTFQGGKLHALCLTSAGEWVPTWLDLNFYLENIDGTLLFAAKPPGNFLQSSQNVNLVATKLSGSTQGSDSSQKTFELNLDYNVVNLEGRLVWLINPHEPPDADDNVASGFGSYDASSDPQLTKYAETLLPHRPPRDIQITPPASQSENTDINRIIARWTLDIMDRGWGQRMLVEFRREIPGWRIDNQENGAFNLNGLQYYSIAVQHGSNVYSCVLVLVGYNIGRTRIRNALLRSRDEGRVVRISPPAPTDRRQSPPQDDPRIANIRVQSLSWVVVVGLGLVYL